MVLLIRAWRSLGFYYTEKIDIFYLEMENSRTKLPYFYDNMILEILRTRNITPPSYKLFNLEVGTEMYRLFWWYNMFINNFLEDIIYE